MLSHRYLRQGRSRDDGIGMKFDSRTGSFSVVEEIGSQCCILHLSKGPSDRTSVSIES